MYRMKLLICTGSGCVSNGALRIKEAFEEELKKHNLQEEIQLVTTGCRGYCAKGPMVYVEPEGIVYQIHSQETVPGVVKEHFLEGKPVQKLMYTSQNGGYPVPKMKDIGFFGKQRLVALANRGVIDPEKIDEYIARDGYRALAKALTRMTPEGIIEEIKRAGLRGRSAGTSPETRSTSSATPTRVTQAHSWTARSWSLILTR
jgi:(2Fe-2S) ferredoxin